MRLRSVASGLQRYGFELVATSYVEAERYRGSLEIFGTVIIEDGSCPPTLRGVLAIYLRRDGFKGRIAMLFDDLDSDISEMTRFGVNSVWRRPVNFGELAASLII